MTYLRWFSLGFLLFILMIPISWWSIGQYFYINWTQSVLFAGIVIGSIMSYVEITSDPIQKKDTKEEKEKNESE